MHDATHRAPARPDRRARRLVARRRRILLVALALRRCTALAEPLVARAYDRMVDAETRLEPQVRETLNILADYLELLSAKGQRLSFEPHTAARNN